MILWHSATTMLHTVVLSLLGAVWRNGTLQGEEGGSGTNSNSGQSSVISDFTKIMNHLSDAEGIIGILISVLYRTTSFDKHSFRCPNMIWMECCNAYERLSTVTEPVSSWHWGFPRDSRWYMKQHKTPPSAWMAEWSTIQWTASISCRSHSSTRTFFHW
jgi:hypothetical protein